MKSVFEHLGLIFRPVERGDLQKIVELRNDYSTWIHLTDPRPLKPGLQEGWLESVNRSSDRFYWTVQTSDQHFVGLVRMDEYDPLNRSIRVGADVALNLRRMGYGIKIYAGLKEYCFKYLGVHRIWLLVLETNTAAIGLYEKAGFKLEGRQRAAIWRFGRWVDYLMMSLLDGEDK